MVQPEIFFISLNTTFFLTTVLSVPESDRGKWVTDLAIALASNKPTSEYSKRLLEYAKAKSKVNKENGRKGGISKANSSEARKKASEALASALPEVKEEVKREVEVTGEIKEEVKKRTLKPLSEYSDDFVTFWKSYPKKTAKGAAWLEWKKHKPPLEKVLESLEWQKTSKKWQEGFILDPERYIKKRCWEDEPTDTIIPEGYASKGVMGALMRSAELRQRAQQQEVIDAT